MALTRKFLRGMGLTDEQVSAIVEEHTESIDALKDQRDQYKAEADTLKEVQRELDDLKAKGDEGDDWKEKYEKEHADFEKFKKSQEEAKAKSDKINAYKELLKELGISENRIDSIVRITSLEDLGDIKDGKLEKADELKESAKEEWKDFIVGSSTQGAKTAKPPKNDGGKILTKEEIYKTDDKGRYVLSTEERQQALIKLNSSNS